jgi:hypothetical protein
MSTESTLGDSAAGLPHSSGSNTHHPDHFFLDHEKVASFVTVFDEAAVITSTPPGDVAGAKIAVLSSGQRLTTDAVRIGGEHVVELAVCTLPGADAVRDYRAFVTLRAVNARGAISVLGMLFLRGNAETVTQTFRIGLSAFEQDDLRLQLEVETCDLFPLQVGISRLVVCPAGDIGRRF